MVAITRLDLGAGGDRIYWHDRKDAGLAPVVVTLSLLAFLRSVSHGAYVKGAQMRSARALEGRRLVTIRDDAQDGRKPDGQRWYIEPTELGNAIAVYVE